MPVYVPNPAPGLGYGGAEYGYSPYGSGAVAREPYPVTGGYGGRPYGHSSYGSVDVTPPQVSSATSTDGYHIEVYFSEAMRVNATLLNPASYLLTPTLGASTVVTGVAAGTTDGAGVSSVILTHTGTTLGGRYLLQVTGDVEDVVGNVILPTGRAVTLLTLGATPSVIAAPSDGSHVLLTFSEVMLPEGGFSPGVSSTTSYEVVTGYPVPVSVVGVEHPYSSDGAKVLLTVEGMTSATYDLTVGPAEAFDYDGTYLPSSATTFAGVPVGTGTSTAGVTGLLLTKAAGVTYGWDFQDSSGKVLPSSSYRVDITLDASGAVYAPALFDAVLGAVVVSDGAVQVTVTFSRVAGVDVVEVSSGAFFAQVPAVWSAGEVTVTLLRNQKAGIYALLFNGSPLVSSVTGGMTGAPTISPGVRFSLAPTYATTSFPLKSVVCTSTQTVFSGSWNFLHGVTYSFVGSSAMARPSILTRRGPIVKDWGDPTPAAKGDVTVRVNGTEVDIASVNPYVGLVTPVIPIPLTAAGTTSVEVDYSWFPSPALPMVGLNTLGVVLNKWDLPRGWHPPAENPIPAGHEGAMDQQRFPMGIVLAPLHRERPVLIGHRYMGFEKAYTAALNSPTTLLLNQNPHAISRDDLSKTPGDLSASFEGGSTPLAATDPWVLEGADTGYVGTGVDDGYYFLVDSTVDEVSLYSREVDFSFPSSASHVVRLQPQTWTLDGVFTGLCFGLHDDKFLFLVGFLEVDGIKHVGLLRDGTRPYLLSSWVVGPGFTITITSSTTFTVLADSLSLTTLAGGGMTFQIFDGSQAGTYTVPECGVSVDGDVATVTLDPGTPFPANFTKWGGNTAVAYPETPWADGVSTYRLVADVEVGSAQVYVGGALSGLAITATRVSASPAQTVLTLPTTGQGSMFWGSTSRAATSTSKWGLVRYGVTRDSATYHFKGIVVAAEMSDLPEVDDNHEWFITEDFGYSEIDSSGDILLLKSTSGTTDLDTTFGYGRLEPFLSNQVLTDVDVTFKVESGNLGAGDAQLEVLNGERRVLFSTLLYVEGGSPFRRLVQVPSVSVTGIRDPSTEGWSVVGSGLEVLLHDLPMTLVQGNGVSQVFHKSLDVTSPDLTGGRIIEARVAVVASTNVGVGEGPLFGCSAGPSFRDVAVQFLSSPSRVQLVSPVTPGGTDWAAVGAPVGHEWGDGVAHSYRVISDPTTDSVVVIIDDVVLLTVPLTDFTAGGVEGDAYFGVAATSSSTTSEVEWDSFSVVGLPPVAAKRTLGVLRNGGDVDDLDGWEVPRTDASSAPNSDASAVVIEMDWRSDVKARVRLDPAWGVTVFRPDLPPPPYYDGEFATQFTEPSAGWINVEYRHLPRLPSTRQFGRVSFGSLDPRSITQQRWGEVRYRVYTRGDEDFIAPQHMVLNWCNVITSGELLRDTGAEVIEVESATSTLVSLIPTHVRADRVFSVVVDSVVLGPSDWTFDRDTQAIALGAALPSEHSLVTVTFAPGSPVTNTYLCSQPLFQSTTLLNEGTPPVPKSQIGSATREEVFGSAINDPTDTLGDVDFVLNDPFRTVQFQDTAGILYEQLEFCEVDDGNDRNLLSPFSDGPAPEEGLVDVGLSGTAFSDGSGLPGGPKVWGRTGGLSDSVGGFSQSSILFASGGSKVTGGNLGPGTAVLYPSYPAIAGPDRGAVIRTLTMRMRLSSVLTDAVTPVESAVADDVGFSTTASDNVPATYADAESPNPDGVPAPSGNGAVVVEVVDYVTTTYSRVGPWGGEVALALRSQLSGNGYPASGNGFILAGGASLGPGPIVTVLNVQST